MGSGRKHRYNPADFNNALFLTFAFNPISDRAIALGAKLAELILGPSNGPAKRGKPIKVDKVRDSAVAIVAEVLDATKGHLERSVYHGLSPKDFTGQTISYLQFRRVMTGLEHLKYLKKTKGHWNTKSMFAEVATATSGFGRATRWQATQSLIDLCKSMGITYKNIADHFQIKLPRHVLMLRRSSKLVGYRKVRGNLVNYPETETSLRLQAEIKEINEFLQHHKLKGATHRGYRRIFNQGDKPKIYAWNKGGRIYGSGGEDDYLTIKKEERRKVLIDGEKTVEIDIRASYLTMFHSIHGVKLDVSNDPYGIAGLPRDIVKKWVIAAFGSGKPPSKWSIKAGTDYLETSNTGNKLGEDYPLSKVTPKLLAAYPVLQNLKEGGVDCFDLMYRESNAIVASILRLMRQHRTPSFSVHDCLIVKHHDQKLAMNILSEEYEKATGIVPYLKVT